MAVSAQAAQAGNEWTHLNGTPPGKAGAARAVQPLRGELFRLNHAALRQKFASINRGEPAVAKSIGSEIELPMPDGTTARFAIVEAPIMEPELAAKFPDIKTYAGQGIDDPSATVRLDFSPDGFHAQVLSPNGAVYVDPAYRGDAEHHVSYYKRELVKPFNDWHCDLDRSRTAGKGSGGAEQSSSSGVTANKIQSGATLRTYRLAVACTGEYAAYFGGTVSNAMAAIVSAVNRVNGVYETELAIRLVLIGNNNLLIYTNGGTDPYSNDDGGAMLAENQTTIDTTIGSGNYDIGHVFSTGGGGIASLGCVCATGGKARGVTGSPAPTGDSFWIDYVAHEVGHQFGAEHTFNSETGSCDGGNRNPSTAFEPGSGSTIMAYAGICPPNDLQSNSDPYFHAGSLDDIQTFLNSGGGTNCAVLSSSGNTPPTVSISGPTNYTIPASTPFALTAVASDANGDSLTYCWEEMDAGAPAGMTDPDEGTIALFRSWKPTNNPVRYFPKLSSVLANTNWNQEKLPTTSRTMKFRVTVRDNRSGGGGVADADATVTSVAGTGPFVVTVPNTATNWSGARTVSWNVAGTAGAPINASGVNIYLSTNGGLAFPFLLASNAPNTGSAAVVLPNLNSTQARIKVQGTGNIFYDISDANFTVAPGVPTPLVQLQSTALIAESCTPTNGAVDPYETVTVNWTLANVGTAPTTNLVATLLTSNGVYFPSGSQNFGAILAGSNVTRSFTFTPGGSCGGSVTGVVQLVDGAANMGTLVRVFPLGITQSTVVTQVFANAGQIVINDPVDQFDPGYATPYPSSIPVSGVVNPITKVTVSINGLSHTYPEDIDLILQGPGGQYCVLMSSCGGGNPVSGVNFTFDDSAGAFLSNSGQLTSGTYRPTDSFGNGLGTNINALAVSPNGNWNLYVNDWGIGDVGTISGGWTLRFFTQTNASVCCSTLPQPTFTSTTWSNNVVRLIWNAVPGPNYQVQYRTNLTLGSWQNLGAAIPGTNSVLGVTDSVPGVPTRFYRVSVLSP